MLEYMFAVALMFAAFAIGFKVGQEKPAKKPNTSEPKPKTPEEIKRERNFKRLMSYDGGNGDDK